MKKIALSIFALVIIFASSCSRNTVNAIDEINGNMNLPFQLALSEEGLDYDNEYERTEGFGGCGYTLSKEGLMFWVSGWPDVRDTNHVTEYRLTAKEYEVFGISVGNSLDDAVMTLKDHGYARGDKTEEANYGNRAYIYEKNEQVRIMLYVDEDNLINEFWVTAIATNKDNVVS